MNMNKNFIFPTAFLGSNQLKINPLSLSFRGSLKPLEQTFRESYFNRSLNHVRLSIAIGILIYGFFGIVDAILIPEMKYLFWSIRFFSGVPVAVIVLLFSFHQHFEKYMQPSLSLMVLVAGLGIIIMISVAPPHLVFSFYAALIMIFIYLYAFIKIRFIWATLTAWILLGCYDIVAIGILHTPSLLLISNNSFFIGASFLGMLASYSIEYSARKDFFMVHLLEKRQDELDKANRELEQRVQDRTNQLININTKLKREIEERKQTEKALRKNEEKYRLLAENSTDIIWTMDLEPLRFTYFSPSVEKIQGFTPEEALTLPMEETIAQPSLDNAMGILEEELEKEKYLQADPERSRTIVIEAYCKDRSTLWMEAKMKFLRNADNQISGIMGVTRDISERKHAEEKLLQCKKMAALGNLVAGVAHEINTPVGVCITASSFLEDSTKKYCEMLSSGNMTLFDMEKYLGISSEASTIIQSNLNRAADLILSFKQVAVDQSNDEFRAFFLKSYIDEILLSLRPEYSMTGHTINTNCPDTISLYSSPGAFSQIITNLVINSLHHGFENMDTGKIIMDFFLYQNNLVFDYKDNGKGMNESTLKQIFDPFFTTNRAHGGTGLGMHIVYNIVTQKLNGQIECESKLNKGTQFVIKIPIEQGLNIKEDLETARISA